MKNAKFRAYDKNRKEMTYFGALEIGITEGDWHPAVIGQNMGHDTWDWVEGGDFEIMQYSGLKRNKEIYEEDIVEFVEPQLGEKYVGVIKFGSFSVEGGANTMPQMWGWHVYYKNIISIMDRISILETENLKVIGNTYENPEWLGD